jgi:hypothetical protein
MSQSAKTPQHTPLQTFVFQIVSIRLKVGDKDTSVFCGQVFIAGHGLCHGLGASPADPAGFIVQIPDESAHDDSGRLQIRCRQIRNYDSHGRYRAPFDKLIQAAQIRKKWADDPSGRESTNFSEPFYIIFSQQYLQHLFFELPAAYFFIFH